MVKKLLLLAGAALLQFGANATTPDWATKVAPILYNNCTSCHHDGGIAPFGLLSYSDAVLYATSMKADVNSHKMPPWPPDATYSKLAHQRILSAADIATITAWVDGGTPQGNPLLAPPVPVYANHGVIPGTPDLKIKIPTYTSTASTGDVYQCFVVPSGLLADRYISSFEAIPGNPSIVHHVLVYSDTTGECAALQAASTTPPGYPDFGGVGSNSAVLLGGWVPGSMPMSYPHGFGVRLAAHSDIVIQIHYPSGTVGLVDSTEIHFFFTPTTGTTRNVFIQPLLEHDLDISSPLVIPANTTQSFSEEVPGGILPDLTLLGVAPHMHLIGRSIKSYSILPTGDTDKYINIKNWDFHWQGFYMFPKLKKIPVGSRVRAEAFYDNTTANPENPHSPPQLVTAGEATTDEMMIVFLVYSRYQTGDENIIVDSGLVLGTAEQFSNYYHGQQLLEVRPNPAISDIVIKCYLEDADKGDIVLRDMQGRVVKQFRTSELIPTGYSVFTYSVNGLPAGTYSLELKTSQQILSQKLVVVH